MSHLLVSLIAFMLMGLVALITISVKPLDPIERAVKDFSFTDIYYEILNDTGDPEESQLVTIVDITHQTNRAEIAQTLQDIEQLDPKVLGVDCTFDVEGDTFSANDSLVDVARQYDNIVYAMKCTDWANDSEGWERTIHSYFWENVDIREGSVNMPRAKYDNLKRRIPTAEIVQGEVQPSFVSQVKAVYLNEEPTEEQKELYINFSPMRFQVLQPDEVKEHPELIYNRIVLYGSMDSNEDSHWTPAGKVAGVQLLAYGVETMLCEKEVQDVPLVPSCFLSLLIVFLAQMFQVFYIRRTKHSTNLFVKHIAASSYIVGLLTFLLISVFVYVGFIMFKYFNLSFNLGWAISVIAFLGTSRKLYESVKDYLQELSEKHGRLKSIADKLG